VAVLALHKSVKKSGDGPVSPLYAVLWHQPFRAQPLACACISGQRLFHVVRDMSAICNLHVPAITVRYREFSNTASNRKPRTRLQSQCLQIFLVSFHDIVNEILFSLGDRQMSIEHCWHDTQQGKGEVHRENPVPAPLGPSQIPHVLAWESILASVAKGRRLTT
jgi:hypothetical protein